MIAARHPSADPALLSALAPSPPADPPFRPTSSGKNTSFAAAMKQALSKDNPVSSRNETADAAPPESESKSDSIARPAAHSKAGKTSPAKRHRDATRPAAIEEGRNANLEPEAIQARSGRSLFGANDCLSPEVGTAGNVDSDHPLATMASPVIVPTASTKLDVIVAPLPPPVPPTVAIRAELKPSHPAPQEVGYNAEVGPVSTDLPPAALLASLPTESLPAAGATATIVAPAATVREVGASHSSADGATATPIARAAALAPSIDPLPTPKRTDQTPTEPRTLERALQPARTDLAHVESVQDGPALSTTDLSGSTSWPSLMSPTPPPKNAIAPATIPASGMASAKSSPEMKKPEELSRANTAKEQLLPGAPAPTARPADEPSPASNSKAISAVNEFEKYQASAPTTENLPLAATGAMRFPAGLHDLSPGDSTEVRPAPVMDLVLHQISASALELKGVNANSMSVVLRPDAHTEVSLELRMNQGLVDVSAEVKRGDLAGLSAHWNELQQSLSSQGVRLGALGETSPSRFNGQSSEDGFSRSNRHTAERENSRPSPELEPLLMPAPSAIRARLVARAPAAKRLWESWA